MWGPLCLLVTLTRATFETFSFTAPDPKAVSLKPEGLEVIFELHALRHLASPSRGFSVTQLPAWTTSGQGEWHQPAGLSIRPRVLALSAASQPFSTGRPVHVSDTWGGGPDPQAFRTRWESLR